MVFKLRKNLISFIFALFVWSKLNVLTIKKERILEQRKSFE